MKLSVVILTLFVAFAAGELDRQVDWSNVSPIFQLLKQNLEQGEVAAAAGPSRRIVNGEGLHKNIFFCSFDDNNGLCVILQPQHRTNSPIKWVSRLILSRGRRFKRWKLFQVALLIQSPTGTGLCGASVISTTAALSAGE
jgi:hypothetical protein